jgi:hypothetical protein
LIDSRLVLATHRAAAFLRLDAFEMGKEFGAQLMERTAARSVEGGIGIVRNGGADVLVGLAENADGASGKGSR